MKLTRTHYLILATLAAAVAAWWWFDAEGREHRRIESRLHGLAAKLDKTSNAGLLATGAQALAVLDYFTEDAMVEAGQPLHKMQGHDAIKQAVLIVHRQVATLDVKVEQVVIDLAHDRQSATVTALIRGRATGAGSRDADRREYRLDMVKQGNWKIRRCQANALLRRE